MTPEAAVAHGAEFRRCLLHCDVKGLMALHRHTSPHLPEMAVSEATIAMHMARADVTNFPRRVRQYSVDWLQDHGFEKVDGQWRRSVDHEAKVFAEAVGISSVRAGGSKGRFNLEVERVMSDAVLNSLAKGVREPEVQKENMMKARAKLRFRKRLD